MNSYWVNAVVLRSRPLGEADRLVWLLSDAEGKIRASARGARRGRSALVAGTQPFVYASYQLFRGRELDTLSQVQLLRPHLRVHEQLLSLALASYGAELVDLTTMDRQPALGVFQLLLAFLGELDQRPVDRPPRAFPLQSWFELHLLNELGYRPELHECVSCHRPFTAASLASADCWLEPAQGGLICPACHGRDGALLGSTPQLAAKLGGATVSFLQRWQADPLPESALSVVPSQAQTAQLAAALRMYIDYYVNHTIRSLPFLAELMGQGRVEQGGDGGAGEAGTSARGAMRHGDDAADGGSTGG